MGTQVHQREESAPPAVFRNPESLLAAMSQQPGQVATAGDADQDKDQVKCYINGAQAENMDKWEFINEVANSIPEFNNYMGSCAGAGSGDFHMYRAWRRKENFRLAAMRRDENREKADKEWRDQKDAVLKEHEDKVNKKRDKRKAKQARQKAGKKARLEGSTQPGAEAEERGQGEELEKSGVAAADSLVEAEKELIVNKDTEPPNPAPASAQASNSAPVPAPVPAPAPA